MSFERQDFIKDDVIQSVVTLTKDMEKLLSTMTTLTSTVKKTYESLNGGAPINVVKESVDHLTASEKEVIKIQSQLSTAIAKSNTEYIEYKRLVNAVNKEVSDKVKYGAMDTKTMNAQNSSLDSLRLALQRNQQAYSALRTEQERNSKAGKDLLKIIQQQDKDVKSLSQSIGKATDGMGHQQKALEGINIVSGGVATNLGNVLKSAGELVASPMVAGFAALTAVFMALKSAAEIYYKTTIEGEDALASREAASKAFNDVLKGRTLGLGKWADEMGERFLSRWRSLAASITGVDRQTLQQQMKEAEKIAAEEQRIRKAKLIDIADDASTELKIQLLVEQAKNKAHETAVARINALKEANKLASDQEEGDIVLSNREIENYKDQLQLLSDINGKYFDRNKLTKDYTEEEIGALGFTYAEFKKLVDLEILRDNISKNASAARSARNRLEKQQIAEILAEQKDAQKDAEQAALIAKHLAFKIKEDAVKSFDELYKQDSANYSTELKKQLDAVTKNGVDISAAKKKQADEDAAAKKREEDLEQKHQQIIGQLQTQTFHSVAQISNNFTQNKLQNYQLELNALDKQTQREIQLAGDNEEQKKVIEANAEKRRDEINKKMLAEKQRAAKFNKALSLTQATINTAQAVTSALAEYDYVSAILFAALGAVEIAAIASQPIPKYKDGTKGTTSSIIIAGEEGAELYTTPQGKVGLTPDTASIMNLPVGTEIKDHDETMRLLALSSLGEQVQIDNENRVLLEEIKSMKRVYKEVGNKIIDAINDNGGHIEDDFGELMKHKKYRDGSKKITRLKSFGAL